MHEVRGRLLMCLRIHACFAPVGDGEDFEFVAVIKQYKQGREQAVFSYSIPIVLTQTVRVSVPSAPLSILLIPLLLLTLTADGLFSAL